MNGPIWAEGQIESLMLPAAGDRLKTRAERAGVVTVIWVRSAAHQTAGDIMIQPQDGPT